MKSTFNFSFLMLTLIATLPAYAAEPKPITEAVVNAVQQAWCDGLLKIAQVHKEGGDYRAIASTLIDDLYDYKEGKVFFKPT